jgi:hypothetical protein
MHFGHEVGVGQVQLVEAGVDVDPFFVEIGADAAVEDDDFALQAFPE